MSEPKEESSIVRKEDFIEEIIKLRLQGLSAEQIKESNESFQNMPDSTFSTYHWQAGDRIRDIQENEVLSTRVLHATRYEMLYKWFFENDFDNFALKMLECSERLLGLHSNAAIISIHNLVEKKKTPNIYDYNKLTDQEIKRLDELIKKASN